MAKFIAYNPATKRITGVARSKNEPNTIRVTDEEFGKILYDLESFLVDDISKKIYLNPEYVSETRQASESERITKYLTSVQSSIYVSEIEGKVTLDGPAGRHLLLALMASGDSEILIKTDIGYDFKTLRAELKQTVVEKINLHINQSLEESQCLS